MKNDIDPEHYLAKILQDYRRVRTCPPTSLLTSTSPDENDTAHLKTCDFCAQLVGRPISAKIEEKAKTRLEVTAQRHPEKCRPGEIWDIEPSLGGWTGKGRYFTPPIVLVLQVSNDQVTVALTYGEPLLRGPGDIPFGDTLPGFAEPWNIFTLRVKDLKSCWATLSQDVVLQVLLMQKHGRPDNLPPHLNEFQQLEQEIGHFFSQRSRLCCPVTASERMKKYLYAAGRAASKGYSLPAKFVDSLVYFFKSFPESPIDASILSNDFCKGRGDLDPKRATTAMNLGSALLPARGRGVAAPDEQKQSQDGTSAVKQLFDFLEDENIAWYPAKVHLLDKGENRRLLIGLRCLGGTDYKAEALAIPEIFVESELETDTIQKVTVARAPSWIKVIIESENPFPPIDDISIRIIENKEKSICLLVKLEKIAS